MTSTSVGRETSPSRRRLVVVGGRGGFAIETVKPERLGAARRAAKDRRTRCGDPRDGRDRHQVRCGPGHPQRDGRRCPRRSHHPQFRTLVAVEMVGARQERRPDIEQEAPDDEQDQQRRPGNA